MIAFLIYSRKVPVSLAIPVGIILDIIIAYGIATLIRSL